MPTTNDYKFCIVQGKNQISSLFRSKLQELLTERGVSQRQVAIATGLSQQTINNYLRAVSKLPGAHELLALSQYFGVPMEYFVTSAEKGGADKPPASSPVSLPMVPAKEVRRAAERMQRSVEELRVEAERLKRLSGDN